MRGWVTIASRWHGSGHSLLPVASQLPYGSGLPLPSAVGLFPPLFQLPTQVAAVPWDNPSWHGSRHSLLPVASQPPCGGGLSLPAVGTLVPYGGGVAQPTLFDQQAMLAEVNRMVTEAFWLRQPVAPLQSPGAPQPQSRDVSTDICMSSWGGTYLPTLRGYRGGSHKGRALPPAPV